jgi:hypothetical protein
VDKIISRGSIRLLKQVLGFKPAPLIASIVPNHAMILPNDANPSQMEFSEGTGDRARGSHCAHLKALLLGRPLHAA